MNYNWVLLRQPVRSHQVFFQSSWTLTLDSESTRWAGPDFKAMECTMPINFFFYFLSKVVKIILI
jgi:hypothetical protein